MVTIPVSEIKAEPADESEFDAMRPVVLLDEDVDVITPPREFQGDQDDDEEEEEAEVFDERETAIDPPKADRGMPRGTFRAPLQDVTLTSFESLLPVQLPQEAVDLIHRGFRLMPSTDDMGLEVAHEAYVNGLIPG